MVLVEGVWNRNHQKKKKKATCSSYCCKNIARGRGPGGTGFDSQLWASHFGSICGALGSAGEEYQESYLLPHL